MDIINIFTQKITLNNVLPESKASIAFWRTITRMQKKYNNILFCFNNF